MSQIDPLPREPSQASLTLPVGPDDARAAVWLSHKWTRRLALAGGSLVLGLAGLWGDAQLDATRGVREDVQALVQRLDRSDERWQRLAIEAAGRDARVLAVEARVTAVEATCDAALSRRYGRALDRYEQREREKHGSAQEAPTARPPEAP